MSHQDPSARFAQPVSWLGFFCIFLLLARPSVGSGSSPSRPRLLIPPVRHLLALSFLQDPNETLHSSTFMTHDVCHRFLDWPCPKGCEAVHSIRTWLFPEGIYCFRLPAFCYNNDGLSQTCMIFSPWGFSSVVLTMLSTGYRV